MNEYQIPVHDESLRDNGIEGAIDELRRQNPDGYNGGSNYYADRILNYFDDSEMFDPEKVEHCLEEGEWQRLNVMALGENSDTIQIRERFAGENAANLTEELLIEGKQSMARDYWESEPIDDATTIDVEEPDREFSFLSNLRRALI